MRTILGCLCFMVATALVSGGNIQLLSKALTCFSENLYQKIALEPSNVVFSPYSIHSALAMTLLGARDETAEEICSVLFQRLLPELEGHKAARKLIDQWSTVNDVQLAVANALFVRPDYPIEAGFLHRSSKYYLAKCANFDLTAPGGPEQPINEYVEDSTNGVIKDLLPVDFITGDTRVILVNAIFFNGTWEQQFLKEATSKRDFITLDRGIIKIDTMIGSLVVNFKADLLGVDIIELPFKDGRFALDIVLPVADDGITKFENILSTSDLPSDFFQELSPRAVLLTLPKFKIESEFELEVPLQDLGVHRAFSDHANFQGISSTEGLKISQVIHKAVIDVMETGTVAAAATAVKSVTRTLPPPAYKVDHPFMFFLRDKETDVILFQGKFSG